MTAALLYKRIRHYRRAFPEDDAQLPLAQERSYYKIYQLKFQQWLIDPQTPERDERTSSKRSTKEPMNYLLEKIKSPSTNDQQQNKRAISVLSANHRRAKDPPTPTDVFLSEPRPKSILKTTKQSSSPTKYSRIISAPANSQRNPRRKVTLKIPTIEIDHADENLPKSNGHSYTEVSSSTQDFLEKTNQSARQSALNTIISHLHSLGPADLSLWNLYRDLDEKFSASISPRVYRNYERIIL